ncbi:hypothetical protein B5M42_001005 [Paenibacillus athensensis]|nr:hypothetical protein [Paenibacillus athensensis]MCD1257414.1 hypothetical protein [Paenibacillus athensensis]
MEVIEDYRLEAMMKNGGAGSQRAASDVDWRQLALYGVSHALNDLFSLPPEARTAARVEALIERRWTNRGYKFASREHYHHVKRCAVQALVRYAASRQEQAGPLLLFETIQTHISPLNVDLSLNLQLLWGGEKEAAGEFRIHRFVMEARPQENESFFHLATLLGYHAFGRLPQSIEVWSVLGGGGARCQPSLEHLQASYDYLRLIRDYMKEADEEMAPLRRRCT